MSLKATTRGITSINGETGSITITSPDSSITVGGTGSNITLETSGGGGGTIGGSIAVNQVAVGSGTNTIAGSANLTYDGTTLQIASGKIIKGQYSNLAGSAYINPDGSAVLGTSATISNVGNLSIPAIKVTTSPTSGYVLTSDASGNGTWQASGGGGGSPGGTNTQIQYNNSGAFGGADIYYDAATEQTGFQISSPLAVVHADSTFGLSPNPVAAFAASLVAESFPANASATATVIYQPEDSTDCALSGSQSDGSGSYLADGSTNLTANIYAYILVAGQQYYYGTPSTFGFTDNSDSQNFSIPYTWTGLAGAAGYVIQSVGTANNGNPNWTQDLGNVTSFTDDGAQSGSAAIPANFATLAPYSPITPPADSAGCAPLNWSQIDNDGLYFADGSTSGSYSIVGAINIAGTYYYVGSITASGSVSDNSDNNNFGINISWTTISGATDYFVTRSISNNTTGFLSGTKNFGNVSGGTDAGDATWTDTMPSIYSFSGTPRQYEIGGQSLAPDGTTIVYFPTPATYTAMDNNSLPYVIEHDVTLNGNTIYGIAGDPAGSSYNYQNINTATALVEGASGFWTSGVVGPTHYGYLANGANLNRAYEDYGVATGYYAPTALTATTTDPNDSTYYYVQLTQTLGAANTDSKLLRNVNAAGYLTGALSSHLPVSGADYFDFSFFSWADGVTVTPNTTYPPAIIAQGHGASISDPPVAVIKSSDGTYTRLEFQDDTGAMVAYIDTTDGMTLNCAGSGTINLNNAVIASSTFSTGDTVIIAPKTDSHDGLVVKQHSGTQTGALLQFENASGSGTGFASFDKNSSLTLAEGTTSSPGMIIPAGILTSSPVAGAVEWAGGATMPSFTDATPTRHTIASLDISQTFTAAQGFAATTTLGGAFGQPNMHLTTQNPISTVAGDIIFDGSQYYGSDSTIYRIFARLSGASALTPNDFVYADANGFLKADSTLKIVSGVELVTNLTFVAPSIAVNAGGSLTFGSGASISGNPLLSYFATTAAFNPNANEIVVNVTANSNAITLPTAVGITGRTYIIKNTGTGLPPINTTSSQTIEGFASGALKLNQNDEVTVVSDGANYKIVGRVYGFQTANTVFAGPTSGSAAQSAFRALVGADLPNPSATTLGGIQSIAAVTSKWVNTISTSGVPTATQPAFTDISGIITPAQLPINTADLTAQSAAVASVLAVTAPNDGTPHQYRVGGYVDITAIATDVLQFQVSWTDENNTSRTQTFFPMGVTSANLAVTGFTPFSDITIRVKANTSITVATILTTSIGTITYDVGASTQRIN